MSSELDRGELFPTSPIELPKPGQIVQPFDSELVGDIPGLSEKKLKDYLRFLGLARVFTYEPEKTAKQEPGGTMYLLDENGRIVIISHTEFNNITGIAYTYDELGRLTKEVRLLGKQESETYGYKYSSDIPNGTGLYPFEVDISSNP